MNIKVIVFISLLSILIVSKTAECRYILAEVADESVESNESNDDLNGKYYFRLAKRSGFWQKMSDGKRRRPNKWLSYIIKFELILN